jgi:2-polyprenyl-6-methoxyphenol hydroxylase-like FAD-dependent oxidoreductase
MKVIIRDGGRTLAYATTAGDDCQVLPLLAGQGASLASAGKHVLGDQLVSADSIDAALTSYQQRKSTITLD